MFLLAWKDNLRTMKWDELFPSPSVSLREIKYLLGK